MAPMTENKNQPLAALGLLTELPAIQQLRSQIEAAKASNPMLKIKANLRNAAGAWAERMPNVNVNKLNDSKNSRPRTRVLPGGWRQSKGAGRWPAGAAVAFSPLTKGCFAAIIPGDTAAEAVVTMGLYNFLNIYNTLIICRLVLTWFPSPPQAIVEPLSTLCDPYLNLFRGLIPPIGGTLDLSPILAFILLNTLTRYVPEPLPGAYPPHRWHPGPVAHPRLHPPQHPH
uniref:YGGT family protein n=1 Tax=Pyramimonas obovata TaxID=1411642 RepID=A0A6T7YFB6_9CHLO